MTTLFKIRGIIRSKESGIGISGLLVKAYDKDLLFDDLLGSGFSRSDGTFEILSEADDFRDFFERRPDIYLRVLTADSSRLIHATEHSVRWQAGRTEYFEVDIPAAELGELTPRVIGTLVDESGAERIDFEPGESLVLDVSGLVPARVYDISILGGGGAAVLTSRLITDRSGRLPRVIPWPQMGLGEGEEVYFSTPAEAEEALAGREFRVSVQDGDRTLFESPFRFAQASRRPLLYSSDSEGRLRNGFELGQEEVHVSGWRFPAGATVRLFMVRRQFDWHAGDPIEPVAVSRGGSVITEVQTDQRGAFTARLAQRDVEAGSYQFLARVDRPGRYVAEAMVLHDEDVLSSRRLTSLVIRRNFWKAKTVKGGCVMSHDMAGRPIVGRPYFMFTNTFQVGDDVWAALDPAGLDPALIGKKVAIYVIQDKDASQWSVDASLQHLPVLGNNPAVQEFITQPGCINYNDLLVWPNASIPGKYEIVADFGNNPPTPATFARDNTFNPPLDIVDGYFGVGFHVVQDPTTTSQFPFAGSFEYNEGTTVIDAPGEYDNTLPVGQQIDHHNLEQKASVYFPAAFAGATNPLDISAAQAQYPLVVAVHGNSSSPTSYKGYNFLLEHLAHNGFIAASIHIYPPNLPTWSSAKGVSRARALFKHLAILQTKFPGKIDLTKIGLMGHSRGGEAVVIASKLNIDEALGHNFRAIISLAPTDQYGPYSLTGAYHQPFFVLYGSLDGDLVDGPGFRLYDRADPVKSMIFVERACHDRFNTEWDDNDFYFGNMTATDQASVISADAHRTIAKGYMNAFFLWNLYGRSELFDFFTGELTPAQAEAADGGTVKLHVQYEAPAPSGSAAPVIVDRFLNANWQLNDLGGAVTHGGTLPVNPSEGALATLDGFSPHDTAGALIRWDTTTDIYLTNVPAAKQDVSVYQFLSFRIAQRNASASNTPGATQDMYVKLTDAIGNSRSLLVSKFAAVPYPYVRGYSSMTLSALKTVRVPLADYKIEVVGTQKVDLSQVVSITFEFAAKPTGEIEIDDIEFGY